LQGQGQLVPVQGASPAYARQVSTLLGPTDPSQSITLQVSVHGRGPQGAKTLAAQVNDPSSQLYRHYLTPAEYAARFGPDPQDLAHTRAFLQGAGLKVATVNFGGQLITVNSTPGQAEQAFHSYYSLTPPAAVVKPVNGGVSAPGSDEIEVELKLKCSRAWRRMCISMSMRHQNQRYLASLPLWAAVIELCNVYALQQG
jgi:hypothetical protein